MIMTRVYRYQYYRKPQQKQSIMTISTSDSNKLQKHTAVALHITKKNHVSYARKYDSLQYLAILIINNEETAWQVKHIFVIMRLVIYLHLFLLWLYTESPALRAVFTGMLLLVQSISWAQLFKPTNRPSSAFASRRSRNLNYSEPAGVEQTLHSKQKCSMRAPINTFRRHAVYIKHLYLHILWYQRY